MCRAIFAYGTGSTAFPGFARGLPSPGEESSKLEGGSSRKGKQKHAGGKMRQNKMKRTHTSTIHIVTQYTQQNMKTSIQKNNLINKMLFLSVCLFYISTLVNAQTKATAEWVIQDVTITITATEAGADANGTVFRLLGAVKDSEGNDMRSLLLTMWRSKEMEESSSKKMQTASSPSTRN